MTIKDLINNKEAFTKFVKDLWPMVYPNKPLTDEKLNEILNDKETQERCLKANEVIKYREAMKANETKVIQKYGIEEIIKGERQMSSGAGTLSRSLIGHLKLENTPEADEYNKAYLEQFREPDGKVNMLNKELKALINVDKTMAMPTSPDEAFQMGLDPKVNEVTEDAWNIQYLYSGVTGQKMQNLVVPQRKILEGMINISTAAKIYGNPLYLFAKDFSMDDVVNMTMPDFTHKFADYVFSTEDNKELFANYISSSGSLSVASIYCQKVTMEEDTFKTNQAIKDFIVKNNLDPSLRTVSFTKNGAKVSAFEGLKGMIAGDKSFAMEKLDPEVVDAQIEEATKETLIYNNSFSKDIACQTMATEKVDKNNPVAVKNAMIAKVTRNTMLENMMNSCSDRFALEDFRDICNVVANLNFKNCLLDGFDNLKNFKGELDPEVKRIADLGMNAKPEDIDYLLKFVKENPEAGKFIVDGVAQKFGEHFSKQINITGLEELTAVQQVLDSKGIDLNDKSIFTPSDEIKTIFNDVSKEQVYDKQAEIDGLKASNPEMTEILDKANDITSYAPTKITNEISAVAEEVGRIYDRLALADTAKNFGVQKSDIASDGSINIKNVEKTAETFAKVYASEQKISQDTKEKLLDIYDFLDKNDVLPSKNGLVNGEEKVKLYGLASIGLARHAVIEAVESKDVTRIKEAVEAYDKEDAKMKEVFAKVETLGTDRITGNISCARNGSIPPFYRDNYTTTSQLNGFYLMGNIVNATGVSFSEMLDNPAESFKKAHEFFRMNGAEAKYVRKHTQLDVIMDLVNSENGTTNLDTLKMN